jgi:hypothetical protein
MDVDQVVDWLALLGHGVENALGEGATAKPISGGFIQKFVRLDFACSNLFDMHVSNGPFVTGGRL